MSPEQKGSLPLRVEKLFYELQDRIFSDIVRRIKKTGEITSTADYQINKLLTSIFSEITKQSKEVY